jgi:hypothetical protein
MQVEVWLFLTRNFLAMGLNSAYDGPARLIGGPSAWNSQALEADQGWVIDLSDAERQEIVAAFKLNRGRVYTEITKEEFPAPLLAEKLSKARRELEKGRGVSLLRRVPIEGLSDDDVRVMWWGIGTHFAPAVVQNRQGDRMWAVRDDVAGASKVHDLSADRPDGGKPLSSYAKARSNGPLRFHTDGTDALALLCVRTAANGGGSKLASSVTVHDEILRRRPDLHALLCQDYHRMYESTNEMVDGRYYALPVFTRVGNYFSSQYSRTYVEEAQRAGAPKMTAAQDEALDLLAEIAEETCMRFRLEKGDMLFFNNHITYHGREPFDDDVTTAQDRLLLRLWFAPENSRPLAAAYGKVWNSVEPGAYRSSRQRFEAMQDA